MSPGSMLTAFSLYSASNGLVLPAPLGVVWWRSVLSPLVVVSGPVRNLVSRLSFYTFSVFFTYKCGYYESLPIAVCVCCRDEVRFADW